jgi:hypothetical protein
MYATRISEPGGAINEEEIRLTFSSVSKAQRKQQGVCHTVWPCHLHYKKSIFNATKEQLWKFQIFHHAKI